MRGFYKRLLQSQQDRNVVTVRYRLPRDSKDRFKQMQQCKVDEFVAGLPPKTLVYETEKLRLEHPHSTGDAFFEVMRLAGGK